MKDQRGNDKVVRVLQIALLNDVFLNVKRFVYYFSGLIEEDSLSFFEESS